MTSTVVLLSSPSAAAVPETDGQRPCQGLIGAGAGLSRLCRCGDLGPIRTEPPAEPVPIATRRRLRSRRTTPGSVPVNLEQSRARASSDVGHLDVLFARECGVRFHESPHLGIEGLAFIGWKGDDVTAGGNKVHEAVGCEVVGPLDVEAFDGSERKSDSRAGAAHVLLDA